MNVLGRHLSEGEIKELERVAHSQTMQYRYVRRAQYILAANQQRHVCDVVRELDTDRRVVLKWCRRYLESGLNGLLDKQRSGCPRTYSPEQVARLVATALTPPALLDLPFGEWTQVRLAEYMHLQGIGMSPSRVGELLRAEGLRWHTQESWYGQGEVVAPDFVQKRGPLSGHTPSPKKAVRSFA